MKVVKTSDVKPEEATGNLFEGKVTKQSLFDAGMAKELRANLINFGPGAKNVFHTHTNEQILYVTEGEGIVATEHEEQVVTAGTIIFIPAGERHWHGATQNSSFSHISITVPGIKTNF